MTTLTQVPLAERLERDPQAMARLVEIRQLVMRAVEVLRPPKAERTDGPENARVA